MWRICAKNSHRSPKFNENFISSKYMQITNYFDLKFILNLSISITISLFVVFVFGKAIGDFFSGAISFFLKNIGKSLLKKYLPIKFTAGFLEDRISPTQLSYKKNKIVNFGKSNQASLPAYGLDIFIKAYARFPFLYKGSKIRILLVDAKDLLGIYSANKLPGRPTTFALGELKFENNIANHIHIDFKPRTLFGNYQIPINIFFQEKLYQEVLGLTVVNEK